jgi:chromosome partitioning protein
MIKNSRLWKGFAKDVICADRPDLVRNFKIADALYSEKVDHRRKVTEEIIRVIRAHYKDQVFRMEIRVDVRLIEVPSFGQTIFQYDRGSAGAEGYLQLADEIIRRKGRGGQI